jgi:folylpolyglutamate synthase/dihydropteroate synthase
LPRKKKAFDFGKEVKAIARERVGVIPAGKPIVPKSSRKKPKHKKPPGEEGQ